MGRAVAFWNWIARRYARMPVRQEEAYRQKLEKIRARLSPEMRLLEIGCGTGSTALALAPAVAEIHAIDVAEAMIAIAREKAAAAGAANVSFEAVGVEEHLNADPAPADAVLAMNILHLLKDKEAAIRAAHRLLRPGGVFISSTICLKDLENRFVRLIPLLGWLGLPAVRAFSGEALQRSMTAAGFVIEERWRPGPGEPLFLIARKPG